MGALQNTTKSSYMRGTHIVKFLSNRLHVRASGHPHKQLAPAGPQKTTGFFGL